MTTFGRPTLFFLYFVLWIFSSYGQDCDDLDIQLQSEITTSCGALTMTSLHDEMDRPYLYIAHKEAGLTIHNIDNPGVPLSVDTVPVNLFDSLQVMNLTQSGHYLYLAIGNHFTNPQAGGMAIVDVSDPTRVVVTDYFVVPGSESGAGIVRVEGNYAYLGTMQSGLVILDVSDKEDIRMMSQFKPSIDFPVNEPANPKLYNARGMVVQNSIVYLAYDAGGLRIINCEDSAQPVQTGRYANPALYQPMNLPRAYNNVVLDGQYIYVTVDYCGLEVLDVSDTSEIHLVGWWNPYDCPDNNWFTSPVHSNELYHNEACDLLFLSTAKNDMVVLDISDPTQPDSCNAFGSTTNNIGTWGISSYDDEIYLTYVCAAIPFLSIRSLVQILEYSPCSGTTTEEAPESAFKVFPIPSDGTLHIKSDLSFFDQLKLYDMNGSLKFSTDRYLEKMDVSDLPHGIYFIQIIAGDTIGLKKIIIQ